MNDPIELLRHAEKAVAAANWPEARKRFLQVLEVVEHPDALLHLSYIESNADHYSLARAYALRACAQRPRAPATVVRLLNRLRNFNEMGAINWFIEQSPFLLDLDAQGLQVVSAQLSYMGEQKKAVQYLDRAIAQRPGVPQLLLARAQVKVFLGLFDEAERDLAECLKLSPGMPNAWWTLAGLRKQTQSSNHVDQLRNVIASRAHPAKDKTYLYYALHKELDDLGDIPAAAQALDAACKAQRSELKYSDSQTRALFRQLKAMPTSAKSSARAGFTPVFVVGMYRSGTTLLEQLIGGNPNVLNAGELQDMTGCMRNAVDHYCHGVTDELVVARAKGVDFTQVGMQYLHGVSWRLNGQTHITDKWPPNTMNVGFICQALPDAKVIHMTRDPVETCFSNLREMFSGAAQYSYDQTELASYCLQYQDLMRHWHERFPGRILDVDYARLTTDTEQVMREVSEFCGFSFLPTMLDPRSASRSVATASAVQVRGPVVSRSKAKWEPYREYLQPLITGLGLR